MTRNRHGDLLLALLFGLSCGGAGSRQTERPAVNLDGSAGGMTTAANGGAAGQGGRAGQGGPEQLPDAANAHDPDAREANPSSSDVAANPHSKDDATSSCEAGCDAVTGGSRDSGNDAGIDDGRDDGQQPPVLATPGCGLDPGQPLGVATRLTIPTMGFKGPEAADTKKGAWSYQREYFLTLPRLYDKNRPAPLVWLGPGCGGKGSDVHRLDEDAANDTIRVGLTPPPDAIGHSLIPSSGCFDDREGDDSVDWVFYENLYDRLAQQLCFDRNRVFAAGNSSGAWMANELGCKYAGDPTRPIRAVMSNAGGLPIDPRHSPTCTNKPMAGLWVDVNSDIGPSFAFTYAMWRAMGVNGCPPQANPHNAMYENFPIGGGHPEGACRRILGCAAEHPLVRCFVPTWEQGNLVANQAFSRFLKLLTTGP